MSDPRGVLEGTAGGGNTIDANTIEFNIADIDSQQLLVKLRTVTIISQSAAFQTTSGATILGLDVHSRSPGSGSDTLDLKTSEGKSETATIKPNFDDTDRQQIEGLGGVINVIGIELIRLTGNDQNDHFVVNLGRGAATARVRNSAGFDTDIITSNVLPNIEFTKLDDFLLKGDEGSSDPKVVTFLTNELEGANQSKSDFHE